MKTALQKLIATIAPSISIKTLWEHDHDSRFSELTGPGDCFENEDPDEWRAWQSEIRVTVIIGGDEITGSAFLGGTWEKSGDNPATSNPEISGYENQITAEALQELIGEVERAPGDSDYLSRQAITFQIGEALEYLKSESRRDYETQRAEISASL